jgi:hypothetical protein
MFRDNLLPFELIGVYLLAAIVGAIVLAKTPAMAARPPEPPSTGADDGNGASEPAPEPPAETVGAHHGGHGH